MLLLIKFVYFTMNAENYLKICTKPPPPYQNRPADASYNPDDDGDDLAWTSERVAGLSSGGKFREQENTKI